MTPVDIVEALYRSFREQDYASFRQLCAPDLVWAQNEGFPNGRTYHGTEAVIAGVFQANDQRWEGFRFVKESIHAAEGGLVFVIGRYQGMNRSTGKKLDAAVTHVYELREGKVARFRMFADTKTLWDTLG